MRGRSAQGGDSQEPPDHALGRSRGGFTTKFHLVCDGRGLPLAVVLSAGQAHDSTCFETALEASRLPRTRRRARTRPGKLAADKAYNVERIRQWLERRRIEPVIPRRVPKDEGEETFDRDAYRGRNIVERCIGWLKECRRVFSRFDKFARSYLAFLQLAILQRLLKIDFSNRA